MNRNKTGLLVIGLTFATLTGCTSKEKELPMKMNEPRNIRGVVSYKRSFNDLNKVHLDAAQRIGIKPVDSREEADLSIDKLCHIQSNPLFHVDSLIHSIPYLVPPADRKSVV